jgi:hypothetical protein
MRRGAGHDRGGRDLYAAPAYSGAPGFRRGEIDTEFLARSGLMAEKKKALGDNEARLDFEVAKRSLT